MPYFKNLVLTEIVGEAPVPVLKGIDSAMALQVVSSIQNGEQSSEMTEIIDLAVKDCQQNGDQIGEIMDGIEPTSSRPPTPHGKASGHQLPARLTCLLPPKNYGSVVDYTIFRSSYPSAANINFLESLHVESILTLVNKIEPCDEYVEYLDRYYIRRKVLEIEPNKDGHVKSNLDAICEAVIFALNPNHHPVYIHCNQGKHRTGCVVAIIRKVQKWPIEAIIAEYKLYAGSKARDGDIELIKNFDAKSVLEYAQEKDLLAGFERRFDSPFDHRRADSAVQVMRNLVGFEDLMDSDSEDSGTDESEGGGIFYL